MQLFKLETPVANKISSFIDKYQTAGTIPANDVIKVLDFEPEDMFISDSVDGAIAVYGSQIEFPESRGADTEKQESMSRLTIDCYGFGAPVPNGGDPLDRLPQVREAQIRAEILVSIAYKALVDRREMEGAPDEGIDKQFGSGVDYGVDKYPVSIQKFSPRGAVDSKRGVCVYRMIFKFELEEDAVTEALGVAYEGSDNLYSETYNPGGEPEGDS